MVTIQFCNFNKKHPVLVKLMHRPFAIKVPNFSQIHWSKQ